MSKKVSNFDLNYAINLHVGNPMFAFTPTTHPKIIDIFKIQKDMEDKQPIDLDAVKTKYGIENMNDIPKDKAKILLKEGYVMTHKYFEPHEFVFQRNFTMIFEDDCKIDETTFWKDRVGIGFDSGWSLFIKK